MRILVGLREVAGIMGRLAGGLEALGHKVTFVELTPHPYGYNEHRLRSPIVRRAVTLGPEREKPSVRDRIARFWFVLRVALTHEAFILCGGESFTHQSRSWDLWLLKVLRRRVVFLMLGTDHRPPWQSYHGWRKMVDGTEGPLTGLELAERVQWVKQKIRRAERWAHAVVAPGMSAALHAQPLINVQRIGLPVPELSVTTAEPEGPLSGPPRVLHCPSHREGKGTVLVRRAVERLVASGLPLEFRELYGVPNHAVFTALSECDFVIDELFSDTPMACFASEAALMGKPAVVCGFGWDVLAKQWPRAQWPPVFAGTADSLQELLASLVRDRERVRQTGVAARRFVLANWSAKDFAGKLCLIIEGRHPAEWNFDPRSDPYPWGMGVQKWQVRLMVRTLLRLKGPAALGLDGCPELEKFFLHQMPEPESETAAAMEERIVELEAMLQRKEEKLENFRGMIARREARIAKLERKLGLRTRPATDDGAGD